MSIDIKTIPTGNYQANCYILTDGQRACIIDPGHEGNILLEALADYTLEAILLTHRHFDHVGAAQFIKDKTGAPIYMHEADLAAAQSEEAFREAQAVNSFVPHAIKGADVLVEDGSRVDLSFIHFDVLHTPGHSAGGVCFYTDTDIFTGDTLFKGSMGRTDFESGNQNQLFTSLVKISKLPETLRVRPGHGGASSIQDEKSSNQFMQFAIAHFSL